MEVAAIVCAALGSPGCKWIRNADLLGFREVDPLGLVGQFLCRLVVFARFAPPPGSLGVAGRGEHFGVMVEPVHVEADPHCAGARRRSRRVGRCSGGSLLSRVSVVVSIHISTRTYQSRPRQIRQDSLVRGERRIAWRSGSRSAGRPRGPNSRRWPAPARWRLAR